MKYANNVRVVMIHELENNICIQALENYFAIGPKAHNFVSNINP
jgi:hypothetical protein